MGICVEFKSEKGKRKLLEHDKRFTQGVSLMPHIEESKAAYGSLAGSQLNLALRLIQAGAASPAGDLGSFSLENESLKEVAMNGHRWWILPEDTEEHLLADVSLWRN